MKMEKKRDFSVKELLSWGAVHSGYLSKVEKKSSFATTKKAVQRFCVIFNGELFIFAEKTSSIPLCNFILSNYCVELFAEPGRAQTLTQSYYINLQCENNTTQHQFVCSTYWEAEKWLNIIKNEMASYYPNGEKINGGSYDYAQTKPTDISFSNPEKYDEKITNELFTGTSNTFDDHGILPDSNKSFRGPTCRLTPAVFMPSSPKLSKSPERSTPLSTSPIIESDHYKSPTVKEACACPIPPPRPEHTKKQMHSLAPHNEAEQSKKQTHSQGRRYEVSEIDAEAVGSPSRLPNGIKGPPKLPPRVLPQVPPDNRMSDATILPTTVYRWNMKRENAIELLKAKNVIGTYIIRKNSDERHVLTIYTAEKQSCRHFIIFQKNGQQFLASEPEPKFTKIGDLIRYYMKNNLPTCKIRLKQPYS